MNKIKEYIYQYRLLVIVVCLCLGLSAGYFLYQSFSNTKQGYVTHVENGDDAVVEETGDITVTKDELYQYFLNQNGLNLTLDAAITQIADYEITDQKAIDELVEKTVKEYETYLGGDLNSYAVENGYKDVEDFKQQLLVPDAKIQLLQEKYASEQLSDIVKDKKVKYIKAIEFDTESQALKMIKELQSEEAFDAKLNELQGSDYGIVCSDSTNVDENIVKKLSKFTKDGIYSKAIKTSESKYAIIYVYNSDIKANKDKIASDIITLPNFAQDCETFYCKKYQLEVHEPIIKDQVIEISEDYFG